MASTQIYLAPLREIAQSNAKFLWSTATLKERERARRHWNGEGQVFDGIVVKKEEGRGERQEKNGGRTDAAFQKSFYESHM